MFFQIFKSLQVKCANVNVPLKVIMGNTSYTPVSFSYPSSCSPSASQVELDLPPACACVHCPTWLAARPDANFYF